MTEKTEKKMSRFLKDHPCIYFTRTMEKSNSGVKEMCTNEQYLNECGYTFDSFATIVLQEGIPK